MNTKQLRQKILDLAIRGKLVPQNPDDEPASVLLERIRAEKERQIKEGKIKRGKQDRATTVKPHYANVPFPLPAGWAWCRFSQIATFAGGKTPPTSNRNLWDGTINWATSKDMKSKYINSTITKISDSGAKQMQFFQPKTLLMVVRSGILRHTFPIAILRQESTVNQDIKTASFNFPDMCEFVYTYLLATQESILNQYAKSGTTVESINVDELKEILIPIPPLAEQRRIVAAVESAFTLIDEIEHNKADLQSAVAAAKRKILSLAVAGRLVPQDPGDEPASALLERIRAGREALAKTAKPKRAATVPAAKQKPDKPHYQKLPNGWVDCILFEIATIIRGITFPAIAKVNEPLPNTVRCLTTGSVQTKHNTLSDVFVDKSFLKNDKQWLQQKDIVMSSANSTELVGKSFIWDKKDQATFGGFLTVIRCNKFVNSDYIGLVLLHLWKSGAFVFASTQTTNIANINNQVLATTQIVIPPLAEQQRIVITIETIFEQLDGIAATLV